MLPCCAELCFVQPGVSSCCGCTRGLLSWSFLCLPLQGAPGRMGAQGEPGLKGYQVRFWFYFHPLASSSSEL